MTSAVHSHIKKSAASNAKRDAMTIFKCPIQILRRISATQNQRQKFTHDPMILCDRSFIPFMAIHFYLLNAVLLPHISFIDSQLMWSTLRSFPIFNLLVDRSQWHDFNKSKGITYKKPGDSFFVKIFKI